MVGRAVGDRSVDAATRRCAFEYLSSGEKMVGRTRDHPLCGTCRIYEDWSRLPQAVHSVELSSTTCLQRGQWKITGSRPGTVGGGRSGHRPRRGNGHTSRWYHLTSPSSRAADGTARPAARGRRVLSRAPKESLVTRSVSRSAPDQIPRPSQEWLTPRRSTLRAGTRSRRLRNDRLPEPAYRRARSRRRGTAARTEPPIRRSRRRPRRRKSTCVLAASSRVEYRPMSRPCPAVLEILAGSAPTNNPLVGAEVHSHAASCAEADWSPLNDARGSPLACLRRTSWRSAVCLPVSSIPPWSRQPGENRSPSGGARQLQECSEQESMRLLRTLKGQAHPSGSTSASSSPT